MPRNPNLQVAEESASFTNAEGVRISVSRRLEDSNIPSRVDLQVGDLNMSAISGSSKGIGERDGVPDYIMINNRRFNHPGMARDLGKLINDALRDDGRIDASEAPVLMQGAQDLQQRAREIWSR